MKNSNQKRIKELLDRLGRISAADEWGEDINPTQRTALSYLARANKFSRSPSQVSDFMTATRGTVSQTLKALAKKRLIEEVRSEQDKRSISYSVTKQGDDFFQKQNIIEDALSSLDNDESNNLLEGLETLVINALKLRKLRPFGVCKTCIYHKKKNNGGYCKLLNEELSEVETRQICHEHSKVV